MTRQKMSSTKVLIDPSSRILYASYYIKGLYAVFGKTNVSFSSVPFKDLKRSAADFSFEHYFAFVLWEAGEKPQKIVVDFCDPPDIHPIAYAWSDRYAKINFNLAETHHDYLDKIIPIPPGFGINIWNKWETFYICGKNYLHTRKQPIVAKKRFLRDYFQQLKRPRLRDYLSLPKEINSRRIPYIFMIASLWADENAQDTTNAQRKKFMETIQEMDCDFEGGFYTGDNTDTAYAQLSFIKPYAPADYLNKTKTSFLVFNTPAVHGCFGWKLGEFLAMGKAIVSTPLYNDLQEPLRHKKEVHIIHTGANQKEEINLLFKDRAYKKSLENNARKYFKKYASPRAVINNIVHCQLPQIYSDRKLDQPK